jgi:hypothetical protein
MRAVLSLLWYLALAAGTWHVFTIGRSATRHPAPLDRARVAAHALGVAGLVIWCSFVLDEARRTIGYGNDGWADPMNWLGLLGTAAISAVPIIAPLWTPRWLLTGQPGTARCTAAALVGGAVTVFAFACIAIAGVMFLFADTASEWARAMLGVALPLGALMLVSMTLSATARLAATDRRA